MLYAIIFISSALLFYTIGVWSEKKQLELKRWHLIIFWIGLVFDTTGTFVMSTLTNGSFQFDFHGITGLLAILLMLGHVLWATYVLTKNDEAMKVKFHKFSLAVWSLWLIPYVSGMIYGIMSGVGA